MTQKERDRLRYEARKNCARCGREYMWDHQNSWAQFRDSNCCSRTCSALLPYTGKKEKNICKDKGSS